MTASVVGAAYEAGRLIAENGADPHAAGIGAGCTALIVAGTALWYKTVDVIGHVAEENARARVAIITPVEAPKTYHELRAEAMNGPYMLTSEDRGSGQFIRFDDTHTRPDQLLKLALYVAAGDVRLNINLWSTRAENRYTWKREDYEYFLDELVEQGLAVADGAEHCTLTHTGKTWLREMAKRSGQPLPHWQKASRAAKTRGPAYTIGTQGA